MKKIHLLPLAVLALAAGPGRAQPSALDQLRASDKSAAPAAVPTPAAKPAAAEQEPPAAASRPIVHEISEEDLYGTLGKQFVTALEQTSGWKVPAKYFYVISRAEDLSTAMVAAEKLSHLFKRLNFKHDAQLFKLKGKSIVFVTYGEVWPEDEAGGIQESLNQRVIDSLPTLSDQADREAAAMMLNGQVMDGHQLFR